MANEVARVLNIPNSLIKAELEGLYGEAVLQDMQDIIKLYEIYEEGAKFLSPSNLDYTPADLRYKTISALINKEARFMFSKTPDFFVDVPVDGSKEEVKRNKEAASVYKALIDTVLEKNLFAAALLKGAKDCFIGKRVALMFNIDEEKGIQISFLPSLEFVYDTDPNDVNRLTKLVVFYNITEDKNKSDQRIYKKKYWMETDGFAHYSEAVYDGMGKEVEVIQENQATLFEFIPAWVLINDGLSGDLKGSSEVNELQYKESWYNSLSSKDMDAERTGMNPIRYGLDLNPETTNNLTIAPGSFWDLESNQNTAATGGKGMVGTLESNMNHTAAVSVTLDRIKNSMYEATAVPNVSPEALKGVVSSGKTLKAIYWDLIVRCDEKFLTWRPVLKMLAETIIEGVRMYPKAAEKYIKDLELPEIEYTIRVDNQYPLPEDETEEKTVDLAEVQAQTMSRKTYMKKWRQLTDDEADDELRQIVLEKQLLEDSYMNPGAPGEEGEEGEEGGKKPEGEEGEE